MENMKQAVITFDARKSLGPRKFLFAKVVWIVALVLPLFLAQHAYCKEAASPGKILSLQAGTCCSYIFIGGKWVKVCRPC